jgi:hypothetical protein
LTRAGVDFHRTCEGLLRELKAAAAAAPTAAAAADPAADDKEDDDSVRARAGV